MEESRTYSSISCKGTVPISTRCGVGMQHTLLTAVAAGCTLPACNMSAIHKSTLYYLLIYSEGVKRHKDKDERRTRELSLLSLPVTSELK